MGRAFAMRVVRVVVGAAGTGEGIVRALVREGAAAVLPAGGGIEVNGGLGHC